MPYIPPTEVHAPHRFWNLMDVLFDGGEGGFSLAIGRWKREAIMVMRWNGTDEDPLGNPQSRGIPVWFIVPHQCRHAVLSSTPVENTAADSALRFLGIPI